MDNLGIVRLDASSLWPVALIATGAAIIFGYWRVGTDRVPETGDGLNVASLFSRSNQIAAGDHFRGSNVSATFGNAELDLRAATVVDGVAAVNATALFRPHRPPDPVRLGGRCALIRDLRKHPIQTCGTIRPASQAHDHRLLSVR